MKYLILILMMSFPSFANYKIDPLKDSCGVGTRCTFDTKKICERFIATYHKSRPLSDCIDISDEVAAAEVQKLLDIDDRDQVRLMTQKITDSSLPLWHKRLLRRLIKDMRD